MEKETAIQNRILAELSARGHFARNHTVGQFYTKYGQMINIGYHGEADIWGFRHSDGKAFFLECKVPGKYPRKDQYAFLDAVKKMGAISGWCTSVEEAIRIVEEGL